MREGVTVAQAAFSAFLAELEWTGADVQKTFCHQVGRAHHRLLFQSLGLEPQIDFATFAFLGNTGSTALPMTAALGIENGHLQKNDRVALLGIGSGINVHHARPGLAAEPGRQAAARRRPPSAPRTSTEGAIAWIERSAAALLASNRSRPGELRSV